MNKPVSPYLYGYNFSFIILLRFFINMTTSESEINNESIKGVGDVEMNTFTVLPEKTTTFVEDGDVAKTSMETKVDNSRFDTEYTSIIDFLAKPVLLQTNMWPDYTAAPPNGPPLYSTSVYAILNSNTMYMDKLRGFAYMRGTVHFKIVLNAQPFQCGKLLIHFIPGAANNPASMVALRNISYITKTQQPHVILDASETTAEISVPYIAPSDFCSLKDGYYDWGTFYVSVLNGLRTGAGAPDVDAPYSMYMWFTDVELSGPLVPQSGKGKRVKIKTAKEEEIADTTNSISKALLLSSSALTTMGDIPLLSSVCKPLGWATGVAGKTAASLGYSKETSMVNPGHQARIYDRFASCGDGSDPSFPLALSSQNQIVRSDGFSIREHDEMSFYFLKKVSCCTFQYTWAHDVGVGTNLFNLPIGPTTFFNVDTVVRAGHTATYAVGHPIWYLSKLFKYYRGGFRITFKFAKTQFHTGRLQATFTPYYTVTTLPTTINSHYALRTIIDMRTSNEFSFDVPYMLPSDYQDILGYTGRLVLTVLNPLRSPSTCSNVIDINMFVEGLDDFEFAGPTGGKGNENRASGTTTVLTPQTGAADRYNSSSDLTYASRSIGESFTSVRQLLLRLSPILVTTNNVITGPDNARLWPYFIPTYILDAGGLPSTSRMWGDAYGFIAPMYAIYRGSMRIKVYGSFQNQPTAIITASICADDDVDSGINVFTATGPSFVTAFNVGTKTTPTSCGLGITTTDNNVSAPVFKIPYYCKYKFSWITLDAANPDLIPTQGWHPVSVLNLSVSSTSINFARSIDDDFQLSYFIGCPPLLVSYV